MSRKRFDEFYNFDGCVNNLLEKVGLVKVSGWSGVRALNSGGFFFGLNDNDGKNKRLAVVFDSREIAEKMFDLVIGEIK